VPETEPNRVIERALDVLLCFSRQTPELTMTQIAQQLGIHKSTIHRLLATLERRRFVQRDPATGVYRLGIRMLQMAYLTLEHNDLRRLAAPFLQELLREHRETVDLCMLDGAEVVFLDVLESPQRVKLAAAIGQRLPIHATASGKSMLAFLPDEPVQRILKAGLPRHTEHTICSPAAFIEDLMLVRHRGYALDEQELEVGINAVAAPIFDQKGDPTAAVAIAGPAYRLFRERMIEIAPSLIAVTGRISAEVALAARPRPPANGSARDSD
jgi:DNA-binding IclR family transcriptional regulator